MKLGTAEVDITPPLPIYLGGYGDRQLPAQKIATPLQAQIFILGGDEKYIIITADIIAVPRPLVQKIKQKVKTLTDIAEENIIISCSHTHSGPALRRYLLQENLKSSPTSPIPEIIATNENYENWLIDTLTGGVYKAAKQLEKVKLATAFTPSLDIGRSRREPKKELTNKALVLAFQNNHQVIKGILFNYACHPTVLGADILSVAPDYPGAARKIINKAYPKAVTGFLNGACADISTRFTRREQNLAEVNRLGYLLGGQIVSNISNLNFEETDIEIAARQIEFKAQFREFPSEEELNLTIKDCQQNLDKIIEGEKLPPEKRKIKTDLQGAQKLKKFNQLKNKLERDVELNIWQLGPVNIVTIPGELFFTLGAKIKQEAPGQKTIIAGYTNGYLGYIPTAKTYTEGGYEALSTPLAKGTGEQIATAISKSWN
jgi:hypothetical protein